LTEISVLAIDRQRAFVEALAARLAAEPDISVVAATESTASARRLFVGRHFDVGLLDAELPGGFDLLAELAGNGAFSPSVRVIMLGVLPVAEKIADAIRAGVVGWVPKQESTAYLLAAVRGVMRDEIWLPRPAMSQVVRLLLDEHDERQTVRHMLATLTPREREVLSHLTEGLGRHAVADRMQLSRHTIHSHLQNLMAKLDVHSALEAVALARKAQPREPPLFR
jgi:DNA-binding NarL/FixJ family response regulator